MNALDPFIFQWNTSLWHALTVALLMLTAFFGCGKLLLRSFPGENLIAFSCGTALFMTFFALLPPNKILLGGALLPFALWGIRHICPLIKKNLTETFLFSGIFLFTLGSAFLLPYGWDEQTYQLALPLRFLQNNSFAPCPDNPYSCYPALTGWFFANAIALDLQIFHTPRSRTGVNALTRIRGSVSPPRAMALAKNQPVRAG